MKHSSCRSVTISGLSIASVSGDITSGYRTVTDVVAIIGVVDVYVARSDHTITKIIP